MHWMWKKQAGINNMLLSFRHFSQNPQSHAAEGSAVNRTMSLFVFCSALCSFRQVSYIIFTVVGSPRGFTNTTDTLRAAILALAPEPEVN
jgi:hypothetical protein